MRDVTQIVAQVREELAAELRERVRIRLGEQSPEWLVDQLMALVLRADEAPYTIPRQVPRGPAGEGLYLPPPRDAEGGHDHAARNGGDSGREPGPGGSSGEAATGWAEDDRAARAARVRRLGLDRDSLPGYVERYRSLGREVLEAEGYLVDPPGKGGPLIAPRHRTPRGESLLAEAKDVLHALLFGGEEHGVRLDRAERELLTLTVPRGKAHAVASFLRAATAFAAEGAWRDPRRAGGDDPSPNVVLQVEYGEARDELVGKAVMAALRLINDLEINERVLYGRMEDIEESTLDP
ncbi:hypothetical protein [Sphaerisporangium sp. TRM90804]|uniref:hypothetical protein n=1 Tax=Sphaerisporangium sp. TRM90804 TaxID=3031113 RepID=UPI00244CD558|nr:hypothetical protein [Sphaerisporangium sp. TRM90804]MDH2425506.1 hypothetical protein [Sphaerisporangium sp. TRM90804]